MSIMQESDFKAIYENEGIADTWSKVANISTELTLEGNCLENEVASDDNKIKQEVEFNLLISGNPINEPFVCRNYFSHKPLRRINGCGKVAKHELLVLKPDQRGNKAKLIHETEFKYYKDNNKFDEIQVDAAWSGIIVWKRVGLTYQDKNFEEELKTLFYIPYLEIIKRHTDDEINDIIQILDNEGFGKINIQYLVATMKLQDIITLFPNECEENIKRHYELMEKVTDLQSDVKIALTDFVRIISTTYKNHSKYQTIPMYRRVK